MSSNTFLEFTGERYLPECRGQIRHEHLHRYAIAMPLAAGKRVLDIACGEGYGSSLLAATAAHVTGLDRDTATIEHARARYGDARLTFLCAETDDIPLADHSVDLIVSFETLEHVEHQARMLHELRRVLVPDGRLLLSSPNKSVYGEGGITNPFHVYELEYDELWTALTRHFEHVEIFGQKMAAGSAVFSLERASPASPAWYSGNVESISRGFPPFRAPTYFLAMCGARGNGRPDISSMFLDSEDDVFGDLARHVVALQDRESTVDGDVREDREELLRNLSALEHETVVARETVRVLRAAADGWMDERVRLAREHSSALAATREREQERTRALARIVAAEHEELSAMLESTSWRVTRPLRRFAALLRARRRAR